MLNLKHVFDMLAGCVYAHIAFVFGGACYTAAATLSDCVIE